MKVPPHRPTEQERIRKLIAGEVVCKRCGRPAGHPDCFHVSDEAVWDRLAAPTHNPTLIPARGELWGIPYPVHPPMRPQFQNDRWTKPKGEDENYHYTAPTGWELHIRKNDNSGYDYTIHYEISPLASKLGHLGDLFSRQAKRRKEQNRRIMGKSTYTEPVALRI